MCNILMSIKASCIWEQSEFLRGSKQGLREELQKIVHKPHRFQTFCPVHHGVNVGDWERVGNFEVPQFAQAFPIFKNEVFI